MTNFQMYSDIKGTIWIREYYDIEANSLEEAKQLAVELCKSDEFSDLHVESIETLYETFQPISISDNGGEPTLELFVERELVLNNLPKESN